MQQDLIALNRKAIDVARAYTGRIAWPTVAMVVGVLAVFVGNLWAFAAGLLPLWAAVLVYAVMTYMSYTPLHEAAHGNINGGRDGSKWLNDLCGYLVAPIIMVPYSTHRVEHFTHHRYTNQPDKDPDFVVKGMSDGFLAFVGCGFRFLWVQNTFLFRDYWATAPLREKLTYGAEVSLAIGWRLAVALLVAREGMLLVLVAAVIWGAFALTRLVLQAVSTRAEDWIGRMLDWSRRHRRLGSFGAALADPTQPETPVLALLALLLGVLGAVALYLMAAPTLHAYPWPSDAAIFQSLRDLHTPYGIAIASAILHLGEWPVYLPVAAVMLISLVMQRKPRAAAHWLAALAFGGVLSLALSRVPTVEAPHAYFGLPPPPGFSARDLVLTTVIYGLIPVLLSTRQPAALRTWFYGLASALVALVAASRLYLGAQWFSHAAIFLVIGLLWTALLGLGYRRHRATPVGLVATLMPVLMVFVIAAGAQWSVDDRNLLPASRQAEVRSGFTWTEWQQGAHDQFATQRYDIAGRPKQPLNLQWAGTLDVIEHSLLADGWTPPPSVASAELLRWLSDTAPLASLPVLPQIHNGERQALVLRLAQSDQQQWLLRLWPADARFDDGTPLWIGSLSLQDARSAYLGLLRLPIAVASVPPDPLLRPAAPLMRQVGDLYLLTTPAPQSESMHDG